MWTPTMALAPSADAVSRARWNSSSIRSGQTSEVEARYAKEIEGSYKTRHV
jgi:hypothetical protein